MHMISVENLKPGDVVARPLWDEMGQVLLHPGVVLEEKYIRALKEKGFSQIYVRDADFPLDVQPEEDIDPVTRVRAIKALKEAYSAIGNELKRHQFSTMDDIRQVCSSGAMKSLFGDGGPIAALQRIVSGILDEVLTRSTLAGLTSIKTASNQLYEHSLDVCILAILTARSVGSSNIRLIQVATGCLLHDIGMVFVGPGDNEQTRIRKHTLLGYELLRCGDDPDILAPHVALEHHEHQDGTGLPRGLVGSNQIRRDRERQDQAIPTLIGEIAAVANVYDNLLSGGRGLPATTPDVAIAALCKGAGTLLNREVVNAFLRVIPVYAKGMEVLVKTDPYKNFVGVVTHVNSTRLDRPVIKLVKTHRGSPITPTEIDLSEDEEITIRCRKV